MPEMGGGGDSFGRQSIEVNDTDMIGIKWNGLPMSNPLLTNAIPIGYAESGAEKLTPITGLC
jgi:hypothetical protein